MTLPSLSARAAKRALLACWAYACLSAGTPALAAEERWIPQDMRSCTATQAAAGNDFPCKQALSQDEAALELDKLKATDFAYALRGDSLTVSMRMLPADLPYPNGPRLCCELQAYLDKIGENVYSAKFRWPRMEAAMLSLNLADVNHRPRFKIEHRGSPAFVLAGDKVVDGLIPRSGADLATIVVDAGAELGERKVTVFKGAACRQALAGCSIIYMPDGDSTRSFASNALANGGDMRRIVVVGVHNAPLDPINTRIEELILGVNEARYDAFMRFVTKDLVRRIEGKETPLRRVAAGYSNGGAWAHDALVTHGGHFDGAIIMSPGQWKTRSDAPLPGRFAIVGAGQMERGFYSAATVIAAGLKTRGAAVHEVYVPSGHSMTTWVNIWNAAMAQLNQREK